MQPLATATRTLRSTCIALPRNFSSSALNQARTPRRGPSTLSRPTTRILTDTGANKSNTTTTTASPEVVAIEAPDAFSDPLVMKDAMDRWGLGAAQYAPLVYPKGRSDIAKLTKKLTEARISTGHMAPKVSKDERNLSRDQNAKEVYDLRSRLKVNPHLHKAPRDERDIEPVPLWKKHKEAIQKKLLGQTWNPKKKLSRQAMDEVRYLHKQFPDEWTTPKLAEHYNVASESIRRILRVNYELAPDRVAQQDEVKKRAKKEAVNDNLERIKAEKHAAWLERKAEREKSKQKGTFSMPIKLGAPKRSSSSG